MTTSPITLPAHRAEAPVWAFHVAVAWITWALAYGVWYVNDVEARTVGRKSTERVAVFVAVLLLASTLTLIGTR